MSAITWPAPLDQPREGVRRRTVSLILAVIIHVLLLWLLLRMAPDLLPFQKTEPKPLTVDLSAEEAVVTTKSKAAEKTKAASGGARPDVRAPVLKPVPKPAEAPAAAPVPLDPPVKLLQLTPQELAMVDSRLSSRRGAGAPAGGGARGDSSGQDEGAGEGKGEGPGGARLYNAEWYRRPTSAELSPYLPAGFSQSGWGMIACQMVDDHRVENCREIGQSPAGSGLAHAVRLAAWQFRVLPPRLGGRVIEGAWVRIRIDYERGVIK
jgi:hypothetical protein